LENFVRMGASQPITITSRTNGNGGVGKMLLAHAYVPVQTWGNVYNAGQALAQGTIFPDLVMPKGAYGPKEGN